MTSIRRAPTHAEISFVARTIWERRGRPENEDSEIWLEAERQLRGGNASGAARNPTVADAAGPLGKLDESEESIEDRLEEFGSPPADRSATSL